nr:hypothetical protein [Tanacetum cinerariifolium]
GGGPHLAGGHQRAQPLGAHFAGAGGRGQRPGLLHPDGAGAAANRLRAAAPAPHRPGRQVPDAVAGQREDAAPEHGAPEHVQQNALTRHAQQRGNNDGRPAQAALPLPVTHPGPPHPRKHEHTRHHAGHGEAHGLPEAQAHAAARQRPAPAAKGSTSNTLSSRRESR